MEKGPIRMEAVCIVDETSQQCQISHCHMASWYHLNLLPPVINQGPFKILVDFVFKYVYYYDHIIMSLVDSMVLQRGVIASQNRGTKLILMVTEDQRKIRIIITNRWTKL